MATFWERFTNFVTLKQYKTYWVVPENVSLTVPRGDYRDRLPTRPEDIAEQYASIVQNGVWTLGLVECWGKRSKVIKSAVHVPCCPSFRFMPWKWRGVCFGRTCLECAFFGCYKTRWARMVHALNLGREFNDPFEGIGRKGREDGDEILCLCIFDQCLAEVLSLGTATGLSILGNCGINCAACYSCHSREKFRRGIYRKFNLPPTFGLPPGIDDCCVHFLCGYCASHQELREAIMRGLDGPGISPLDVHPETWKHVNGYEEEVEYRKAKLEILREAGQLFLPFEQRIDKDPGLAVRAGRGLRLYHYQRLGLPPPEHGKGHFHNPTRNFKASREAKRLLAAQASDGSQLATEMVPVAEDSQPDPMAAPKATEMDGRKK